MDGISFTVTRNPDTFALRDISVNSLRKVTSTRYNYIVFKNSLWLVKSIFRSAFHDFVGAGKSRSIVNGLARDLYIDPELSKHLATMSHSVPSYLYAVSASNLSDKQNGAKYDYVDFSSEDNSGMVNVNVVYHKGLPEPWHYQQLKPREKFEVDLNQRRPLSLTDLRPPPTLPPPPVPKNGKFQDICL